MNSKQLSIILGAVALIAILAAVYFAYGNKTADQTLSNQNAVANMNTPPVNTNVNKPANSNQANDPTSNWKSYNNSKYNVQFRYPQNWHLIQEGPNIAATFLAWFSNYSNTDEYDLGNMPTDLESFNFSIDSPSDTNSTLDDFKPQPDHPYKLVSFTKFFTTDGLEGRKMVQYSDDHPVGNRTSIFFFKNGNKATFSLGIESEDQTKLLEQVASTFKFTK